MLVWHEVQGLRDQHPKVRWAACQAVGQMCTDLGPDFQEAEHARLLPGLMAVMDDFNHPRIQAHSAAAVVNFSENCEQVPCSACTSALHPQSMGRACRPGAHRPVLQAHDNPRKGAWQGKGMLLLHVSSAPVTQTAFSWDGRTAS